ncbi:MAG: DUF2127 domain-containing protein [Candidatus Dormibacteraeota bacterium]|uniref:DUF2127 domain-containing protein n=1 Tax=Candidatus Amunia macphersoniae TaxID=3127014 RepID=A0A934KJ22_9BACT|nr:DUF2127 domain-containing protein [Candidatus Dormibacteraeota bacterium]
MSPLLSWCRWEFGRRIEMNGVIVYLICERLVKATVLIAAGIVLLVAGSHTNLHDVAEEAQRQLSLSGGTSLWRRLFDRVLALVGNHGSSIAIGAIAYGVLELTEAVGLLMRRRWAEYLVLLATVAFLPLELDELIRHLSVLKVLTVTINLAIVWYLVQRKQLFLTRQRSTPQDA